MSNSLKYNLFTHKQYTVLSDEEKTELFDEIINSDDKIDEMLLKGYLPYVYSGCYYGKGGSYEYFSLYHLLNEIYVNHSKSSDKVRRLDNLNYHELGLYFNGKVIAYLGDRVVGRCSRPVFDFVKIEFLKFVTVDDDEGLESIRIDQETTKNKLTKQVLERFHGNEIDSSKAINLIDDIFKIDVDDLIIYYEDVYNCN